MPTDGAQVNAYINNVANTAQGEGANVAKRTDRDGVAIDLFNLAEMPGIRYANGANCPDVASGALTLSIRLRASQVDGANVSEGLIYVGEIAHVYYSVTGTYWRVACAVENVLTITVANLVAGADPANYAALVGLATVHIWVTNGGLLKWSESDLSLGTGTEQINTDSIQAQANSTTAGWFTAADTLSTILNAWATNANRYFTGQFAAWRAGVVTYASLATDALQTARPNLMIPFHHRFPIPYNVGGAAIRTIYYPPGVLQGGAPPGVSNRTTLAAALAPGARYAWQVEMGNGQSAIYWITRQATTATIFADCTITIYLLMRTTAAHTNAAMQVIISDGVASTTTAIAGSGAGGLSATYAWFTATHVVNSAPTQLSVQIINNSGAGTVGLYVAHYDGQETTLVDRRHLPARPSLQYRSIPMVMAGAIGAGYWNHQAVASNTLQPHFVGDIQCLGLDVHEATAPITAGYDVHTVYVETVESDGAPILFNTFTGDVAYTPPAALMINGGAEPGARVWMRCRGVATGAGVDGFAHVWAWILAP